MCSLCLYVSNQKPKRKKDTAVQLVITGLKLQLSLRIPWHPEMSEIKCMFNTVQITGKATEDSGLMEMIKF